MNLLSRIVASIASLFGWLEVVQHRRQLYGFAVLVLPVLVAGSYVTDGTAARVLAILAVLAGAGVPGLARKHAR